MSCLETVLNVLSRTSPLCDDCLSELTHIEPRQNINQCCRKNSSQIDRGRETACVRCYQKKIVNSLRKDVPINTSQQKHNKETRLLEHPDLPWFWEGNVQDRIVSFLKQEGYAIKSFANTQSRQSGKGIIADDTNSLPLWVTVKGFPENRSQTQPATQARHWFSQAIFDLICYHGENPAATLALGIPDVGKTYRNLLKKTEWFKKSLPFKVFWVHEDGSVNES